MDQIVQCLSSLDARLGGLERLRGGLTSEPAGAGGSGAGGSGAGGSRSSVRR